MALRRPFAPNNNGVYCGGPLGRIDAKAASAVTPGALLAAGATAGEVQEAAGGAQHVVGVALDNDWNEDNEDFLTDFAAGEYLPIGTAPGLRFMGVIGASQTINRGDLLMTAAGGELVKWSAAAAGDSAKAVARYVGHDTVTTGVGETARAHVEFLG